MTISTSLRLRRLRRPASRALLALALTVAGWAPPSQARAQVPELQLGWNAPPECPGERALRTELLGLLGREPRANAERGVRVEAQVTRDERGYLLQLESSNAGQLDRRELRADRCEELGHAAALIIALAIDPAAGAAAPGEPAAPVAEVQPEPEPEPARYRHYIAPGGTLDTGSLPSPSAGARFAAGLTRGRFEAQVGLVWLPPVNTDSVPGQAAVQVVAGAAQLCARVVGTKATLSACADGELGRMIARGNDLLASSGRDYSVWGALGGSLALRAWLHPRFALRVTVGALGLLNRQAVTTQQQGNPDVIRVLYRPPPVTGRFGLFGEVWF